MKSVYAEFITTLFIVFFGTGAISLGVLTGGVVATTEIAASFGLTVFLSIWLFGRISGAHSNPAISFALWMQEEITLDQMIAYWIAQFSGATGGALLVLVFFSQDAAGMTLPAPGINLWVAFGLEVFLTFLLVLVVMLHPPAVDTTSHFALALSVSGVYALGVLIGLHVSGGSMNPARSLGPALVSLDFDLLWIYLSAPFVGALFAVFVKRNGFRGEI